MIKYLRHTEIDKHKWDACIQKSTNGLIYAYSWYLDIVCPGWEALVKSDYESIMPLPSKKKYGIHYLLQPPLIQQLGVFHSQDDGTEDVSEFLNAMPDKFRFIQMNLNQENTFNKLKGWETKKNLTHELKLSVPYEEIWNNYSTNIKRNIRKAEKNKFVVNENAEPLELIKLFRQTKGKSLPDVKTGQYNLLKKIIKESLRCGIANSWGVQSDEGQLCAGTFLIRSHNKVIYLFGVADDKAKQSGAMHFLIDYFIKKTAGQKLVLDFEGSNIESLARFYKGFGAKEVVYLQIRRNRLPVLLKWMK